MRINLKFWEPKKPSKLETTVKVIGGTVSAAGTVLGIASQVIQLKCMIDQTTAMKMQAAQPAQATVIKEVRVERMTVENEIYQGE